MKQLLLIFVVSIGALNVQAQQKPYRGGSGKFQKLVWADEFNGTGLPDTTKWNFEKGYLRNNELQYYTEARRENAEQKDGFLQITARNDSLKNGSEVYPITSAALDTKGKGEWTYGRVEVRAKFPSSLGTWPAIWMLGADIAKTGWPACGELDILEHVGFTPDTVHFNVHMEASEKPGNKLKNSMRIFYREPYRDFHVYAIEWFPDRMDWFMDDKKVFTYINEKTGVAAWPFDKPEYVILNLAFGGAWGGQKGVDIAALPQTFLIDYVRVYQ